jgi:ABC-type amino acid transport substrate-binding protein
MHLPPEHHAVPRPAAPCRPSPRHPGHAEKGGHAGSITLGIRESSYPLSYLDEKQQPIGYHIDICNRIVDAVKARSSYRRSRSSTSR